MSLEIKSNIKNILAVDIPDSIIIERSSLNELADYIATQVPKSDIIIPSEKVDKKIEVPQIKTKINENILTSLHLMIAEVLKAEPEQIDINVSLSNFGIDSLMSLEVKRFIQDTYHVELPDNLIIEKQSIQQLFDFIAIQRPEENPSDSQIIALSSPDLIEDNYPLSSMQEIMLKHSLAHPKDDAYLIIFTFSFMIDDFDRKLIEHTLNNICQQNTALRTKFKRDDSHNIVQYVTPNPHYLYVIHDIEHLATDQQNLFVKELYASERQKTFKLLDVQDPLMRINVVQKGANHYEAMMAIHHALIDGWSLGEFVAQLINQY